MGKPAFFIERSWIALNKANFKFSHANVQFTMNEFEFVKAEGHSKQQKVKSRNKET